MGLFEEDLGLLGFRCQTGVVKDCNDDGEGHCIGKGKLRVLGALGDLSKSLGSRNGNGGFGCLFRVQFEHDFHFHVNKWGQKSTII
jgi:hypothetical protein